MHIYAHEFYAQSDALLLADVFNSFWKISREICRIVSARFFFCTKISMTSNRKKCQRIIKPIN